MNIDTTDRPEERLRLVDPVDERRLAAHLDEGTAAALLVVIATSAAGYGAWLALHPGRTPAWAAS